MRQSALVPALLIALILAFFWPLVLHPSKVLYSDYSDALAQHIPYKRFLARSWQDTGQIPLWCPHSLGGAPFIHDPQVSIFYPPNLALLFVPDQFIGAAFSWLLVVQIMAGGLFAYAYGREEGLTPAGAFVAAAGLLPGDLIPAQARHGQVQQHHIRGLGPCLLQRRLAVERHIGVVAVEP